MGLASGTIYPALRRLEDALLIKSKWENQKIVQAEQRPARKYYEVTKAGREVLVEARNRFLRADWRLEWEAELQGRERQLAELDKLEGKTNSNCCGTAWARSPMRCGCNRNDGRMK